MAQKGYRESHYHEAAVTVVRGSFPLDMLRFDACWPSRTQDAADIATSIIDGSPWNLPIHVAKISDRARGAWNIDAWRAAGCDILPRCSCCAPRVLGPQRKQFARDLADFADSLGFHDEAKQLRQLAEQPICRRCELPGPECACEPAGDFA